MVQAELYEQRAEAFLQLCDFQSAKLNLMKVLALAPAQEQHCLARLALVLDLQGQCLLDQELYSEALESFTQAAELQLPIALSLSCSIVCLAALGEFPEFLRVLNRELEEDVRNPDMYVLRAFFYKRFGQLALCHQDIQRALELEPQHRAAQALWQRLLRQGQEAKAQAVLKALCGDLRGALYEISFAIESDPLAAEFFTLRYLFWGTAGNCCSPPDQAACAGCCSAELLAMMLKPGVGWTRGVCFPLALDKALGQQPAPLSC
uniref:Uncharacterized protein n=1 Tax=Phasianus colchicus TaxID=9054 RepID=A0A669Q598_PHACC